MANVYTKDIIENDCNFNQFVWQCAKAFSPFVEQSRGSIEFKPIMEEELDDDLLKDIKEAEKELKALNKIPMKKRQTDFEKQKNTYLEYYENLINKQKKNLDKFKQMKEQVEKWNPPSENHINLKNFMLKQLDESIDHANVIKYEGYIKKAQQETFDNWWTTKIRYAEHEITHAKERYEEEKERMKTDNLWKKQLLACVPYEEVKEKPLPDEED